MRLCGRLARLHSYAPAAGLMLLLMQQGSFLDLGCPLRRVVVVVRLAEQAAPPHSASSVLHRPGATACGREGIRREPRDLTRILLLAMNSRKDVCALPVA
jgi:hypothetical protein